VFEAKSRKLAQSFVHLTGSLQSSLHAKSEMTKQHMELYHKSVNELCETVKDSVDTMDQFVLHCEDINEQLKQARTMYNDM
jgi:hypothetical protein